MRAPAAVLLIAVVVTAARSASAADVDTGRWETIAESAEALGGTNSGVLLPDGRIIYCHDTKDPVILNPVDRSQVRPPQSPRIQGCHAVTLMPDGRVIYVGGADQEVYGPGTRQVKTFNPTTMSWKVEPDLTDYRWYPTMVPLPNGELLTVGGGGLANPVRVKTSEVMDPSTLTWTRVGDVALGNEVSPVVLLYTGEVLMTHRPPQLYSSGTRSWRAAADFVQGNRMANGDHADHELVLLPDGRVVAVGFKSFTANPGNMVEIYDPRMNAWKLGRNTAPVRSRASTILLPDKTILVIGGYKEDKADPTPVNAWGYTAVVDLYDPANDTWKRMAPISVAREYHAMPILVPDGRVFVVGGEGEPGNTPARSTIEVFSPPYLFKGPRAQITNLNKTTFTRGDTITFDLQSSASPTRVVLMGTLATTHFMDSGNGRYLELDFQRMGDQIRAQVPIDPLRSVHGYYTLFVLVGDVPSPGQIVRIVAGAPPSDAGVDAPMPLPADAGADGDVPVPERDAAVDARPALDSREDTGVSVDSARAAIADGSSPAPADGATPLIDAPLGADSPAPAGSDASIGTALDGAGARTQPGPTGCTCQTGHSSPTGGAWSTLLALAFVVWRTRARRHL